MTKRTLIFLVLGLGALILGGFAVYIQRTKLQTLAAHRGPVTEAVYGLGTVKSIKIFEHKQGVISRLRKVFVTEGDRVKSGQRLMDFDQGPTLTAPFDGVVTLLPFHEGENVFPQISLIRIEDLSSRIVEINLEQQASLRVRPGLPVKMSFESIRGETYSGAVESIYPSAGQFLVRVAPRNLPEQILPGMTVDVAIEIQKKENVLLIPASAVNAGFVSILREGKKQKIAVQVGLSDGESVEITGGDIQETDLIVLGKK